MGATGLSKPPNVSFEFCPSSTIHYKIKNQLNSWLFYFMQRRITNTRAHAHIPP